MVMKNYAVVEEGVVVNVVVFDPEPKPNWIESDKASIGDLWDGKSFTRPEPLALPEPAPSPAEMLLAALVKKGVITEEDLKG